MTEALVGESDKVLKMQEAAAEAAEASANGKPVKVTVNYHEKPMGWWREGSKIDQLDKKLSMNVFSLSFGPVPETLLSIPGTWFGLPVSAFIMSNFLTLYIQAKHQLPGSVIFSAVSVVCMGAWGGVFLRYWLSGHVEQAYKLNKYWTVPSIVLPTVMGRLLMPESYHAATFFISAWMISQSLSSTFKTAFCRTRPTVAESTTKKIMGIKRAYPSYRAMLSIGESVFESFPSGDSVGAACFSATLYYLRAPFWTVGVCFLTAFCRMYFQAHHLLDVSAGLTLGWAVGLTLGSTLGVNYFDAPRVAVVSVGFILFILKLQKFKPELPMNLRVEGRKGF